VSPGRLTVSVSLGALQRLAWLPVVAVVGEGACVRVQSIGPVRFRAGGIQHCQLHRVLLRAASGPEPTLVPNAEQLRQRVIPRPTDCSAAIDPVEDKVSTGQLAELECSVAVTGRPCRPPRCELMAARSFVVVGAGRCPAAVCRRRSRPSALLYLSAVRRPVSSCCTAQGRLVTMPGT
jgi:hypothetical protein